MGITFDPAEDALNRARHGVSLALATDLEWAMLLATPDIRRDYGERQRSHTPCLHDRSPVNSGSPRPGKMPPSPPVLPQTRTRMRLVPQNSGA